MGREGSDETYVLGLCDEVLGEVGRHQYRFGWLLGDPGTGGRQVKLPVDSYWPGHRLVVEYRDPPPDRPALGGVPRSEQRARYDARRDDLIPANGIRLVVIRPADLDTDPRGRLRRSRDADLPAIRKILRPAEEGPGDEGRVTTAFRHWLVGAGWTPLPSSDRGTGVEAVRGDERLIAETEDPAERRDTAADLAYGRLLRRMTTGSPPVRYALAVPTSSLPHAERVPAAVRRLLAIDLYEVTDDDEVRPRPA